MAAGKQASAPTSSGAVLEVLEVRVATGVGREYRGLSGWYADHHGQKPGMVLALVASKQLAQDGRISENERQVGSAHALAQTASDATARLARDLEETRALARAALDASDRLARLLAHRDQAAAAEAAARLARFEVLVGGPLAAGDESPDEAEPMQFYVSSVDED